MCVSTVALLSILSSQFLLSPSSLFSSSSPSSALLSSSSRIVNYCLIYPLHLSKQPFDVYLLQCTTCALTHTSSSPIISVMSATQWRERVSPQRGGTFFVSPSPCIYIKQFISTNERYCLYSGPYLKYIEGGTYKSSQY